LEFLLGFENTVKNQMGNIQVDICLFCHNRDFIMGIDRLFAGASLFMVFFQ